MSTFVYAIFEQDSAEANNFDTLMEYIGSAWESPGAYSEDVVEEILGKQSADVQTATRAIIANKWFWMFDVEYSVGCDDENEEPLDGQVVFEIHFMLNPKSTEMGLIADWFKACGATRVALVDGDVDDDDADDHFAMLA